MPYGTIKVDTVTFTNAGVDKSVTLSGLVQNPVFSGNVTVTGTLSGVTVTGTTANFTSGNFTNISGGTHTITSGVFAAGSAASPSITFTGDLNTGIYSPGADQVAISTGGSGRLFVDASGNVGVGTSPSTRLETYAASGGNTLRITNAANTGSDSCSLQFVQGGAQRAVLYTASNILYLTGDATTVLSAGSTSPLVFNAGGSERLRITSAGLVGVGTSSPGYPLDVQGESGGATLRLRGGSGGSSVVQFTDNAVSAQWGTIAATSSSIDVSHGSVVRFLTNSSERARIDSSGRLGIGTTSPGAALNIGADGDFWLSSSVNTAEEKNLISWRIEDGSEGARISAFREAISNAPHSIAFFTRTSGGLTNEKARITSAGNVGIGTTSPSSLLHTSQASGFNIFQQDSGSVGNYLYADSSGQGWVGTRTNHPFVFGTNNSERMKLDTSGRLLVGTSSARGTFFNGTSDTQLQIEGGGNASFVRNSNDAFGAAVILAKTRGSANVIVQNNDELGYLSFQGNDGTDFPVAASINAAVDGTPGANDMPGRLVFSTTRDGQSSPSQALIIENGQQSLFTTSTSTRSTTGWYGVQVDPTVGAINVSRNGSNVMAFFHTSNANGVSGSPVGTISITTTATAYNTSSDYRLKENVTAVTDGIARLQQLKPSRFNFIADPAKTVDGFIAHEVQAVIPEAITGEKDAVDAEGNPVYQGIDQSKLVPLLTAALQEAVAKIESLEARLTAAGI